MRNCGCSTSYVSRRQSTALLRGRDLERWSSTHNFTAQRQSSHSARGFKCCGGRQVGEIAPNGGLLGIDSNYRWSSYFSIGSRQQRQSSSSPGTTPWLASLPFGQGGQDSENHGNIGNDPPTVPCRRCRSRLAPKPTARRALLAVDTASLFRRHAIRGASC